MINLETLFKNHFDAGDISDDKMAKLTMDHVQKLTAGNANGNFTQIIADTSASYDDYYGTTGSEDVKYAFQQSLTKIVNNIVVEFKSAVSQKEGIVRGHFGKEAPEYQEFFPIGLKEYTKANLATVEGLMTRMVFATGKYSETTGAALAEQFADIHKRFSAARKAQLEKIGDVKSTKQQAGAKRDVLETQLMKNLLTLALDNIDQPEKLKLYFDQSIVR